MSEAVNRIRSPLDDFATKREDFYLDSGIKVGAGIVVGSVIGLATRRLVKVRYPILIGGSMGAGMALERYSYQLSAPYMSPPSTPVDPKAPILTNAALPIGGLWAAIFPTTEAEPISEVVAESPTQAVVEEPITPAQPTTETSSEADAGPPEVHTAVDTVVDAVEDAVAEVAEVVEEVVEAALDVVEEVRETVAEAAEEVKEIAEEVIETCDVVEDVSEKIDEIVKIELVEEVEAQAKEVEHVAEEVKEIAQEIVEATKE